MRRRSANERLAPLPDDRAVLQAVAEIEQKPQERYAFGASATNVAWQLDIEPARRLGRGAAKGSWSGSMAPALRISPRLQSLAKRGLLDVYYDRTRFRRYYSLSEQGRAMLDAKEGICSV